MNNQTGRWRRCKLNEAQQYRHRTLTGSIGLEGPWSEWKDGKPNKLQMNLDYEFRTSVGLSTEKKILDSFYETLDYDYFLNFFSCDT